MTILQNKEAIFSPAHRKAELQYLSFSSRLNIVLLAYYRITYYHRHKTVVKDWYGNGFPTSIGGKIELIQETEFSSSSIEMDLNGMKGEAGRFGIFEVQY